ncbi:VanZ family protein [Gorillibacterium sp. CAU 1737]|uniref:VanZ family protein n=1 Tax=Gorillibacterium sp. CAU 1737 TaxID=3140362 RepID=UPI003260E1B1
MGNLVLFVPLGILFPLLWRTDGKRTVLIGAVISVSFEVLQYAFAWGSSDIDDVLYNTLGTLIGWLVFRFGAARLSDPTLLKKVFSLLLLLVGTVGLAVLFYTNSSLFQITPKRVIVENGELLKPVEHQAAYAAGHVKKLDDTTIELEKSIQQAGEARQLVKLTLTENTTLLRELQTISMFLGTITKEVIRYEPLSYADFTQMRDSLAGQNVKVWSHDGKTADVVLFQQLTMD